MGKLTVTTFLTLDGVMQAPGGPQEDTDGAFEYGGWLVPYADDDMLRHMAGWFALAGEFLLGRRTYEIFAAHWPHVTDPDDPIATALNTLPKHVASRTLERVDWANATLIAGEVPDAVSRLKTQSGGELQVHGSGELAQTLLRHHLVDEFRLLVYPVVLGHGKRLFGSGTTPGAMRLTYSATTSTGVLIGAYERAGDVQTGLIGT